MLISKHADNSIRWKNGERLDQLFEQRCDKLDKIGNGNHAAVITDTDTYTFRDLDNRANQLARYLIDQGITSGDRVALLFDKTVERYISLLAVLKVNAAHVLLDANFPKERIELHEGIDIIEKSVVDEFGKTNVTRKEYWHHIGRPATLETGHRNLDTTPPIPDYVERRQRSKAPYLKRNASSASSGSILCMALLRNKRSFQVLKPGKRGFRLSLALTRYQCAAIIYSWLPFLFCQFHLFFKAIFHPVHRFFKNKRDTFLDGCKNGSVYAKQYSLL